MVNFVMPFRPSLGADFGDEGNEWGMMKRGDGSRALEAIRKSVL